MNAQDICVVFCEAIITGPRFGIWRNSPNADQIRRDQAAASLHVGITVTQRSDRRGCLQKQHRAPSPRSCVGLRVRARTGHPTQVGERCFCHIALSHAPACTRPVSTPSRQYKPSANRRPKSAGGCARFVPGRFSTRHARRATRMLADWPAAGRRHSPHSATGDEKKSH